MILFALLGLYVLPVLTGAILFFAGRRDVGVDRSWQQFSHGLRERR